MLILDSKTASPCHIDSEKYPAGGAGVRYRDRLFVKARSFPADKRQAAMHLCRETLGGGRFCIVLKEGDGCQYTLCYQVEPAV